MPTVLKVAGFRFFFYSLEGDEPPRTSTLRMAMTSLNIGWNPYGSLIRMVSAPRN
jgi:hypothetical protein